MFRVTGKQDILKKKFAYRIYWACRCSNFDCACWKKLIK